MDFEFLVETYDTERLKILSVWSQIRAEDLTLRLEPRARTPLEQMIHQCVSEQGWMTKMLGIQTAIPVLPEEETKLGFIRHYAQVSGERLKILSNKPADWYREEVAFFDVPRSRAWVLVRRIAHSAHHRGQLTMFIRGRGQNLYSTYGPSADTGGLPANQARVVYRYPTIEALITAEEEGGEWPPLPGGGALPVTERP